MHIEFDYVLFKVFTNYLDTGVDDTKLGEAIESLKGFKTLQIDLQKLKG